MLILLLFVVAASVVGLAAHRATIAAGRRFGLVSRERSREVSGWPAALFKTVAGAVVGFGLVLLLLMLLNRN